MKKPFSSILLPFLAPSQKRQLGCRWGWGNWKRKRIGGDCICIYSGRNIMENTMRLNSLPFSEPTLIQGNPEPCVNFTINRWDSQWQGIRAQQTTRIEPRRNIRPIKTSIICTRIYLIKNPTVISALTHKIMNNSPLPTLPKASRKSMLLGWNLKLQPHAQWICPCFVFSLEKWDYQYLNNSVNSLWSKCQTALIFLGK